MNEQIKDIEEGLVRVEGFAEQLQMEQNWLKAINNKLDEALNDALDDYHKACIRAEQAEIKVKGLEEEMRGVVMFTNRIDTCGNPIGEVDAGSNPVTDPYYRSQTSTPIEGDGMGGRVEGAGRRLNDRGELHRRPLE